MPKTVETVGNYLKDKIIANKNLLILGPRLTMFRSEIRDCIIFVTDRSLGVDGGMNGFFGNDLHTRDYRPINLVKLSEIAEKYPEDEDIKNLMIEVMVGSV